MSEMGYSYRADVAHRIATALENDDIMEMLTVASHVMAGSHVVALIDRAMAKVRLAKNALAELEALGPKLRETA